MAHLRAIRQRIRSVTSTAKITRAQELIASARIARAQRDLLAARPYARRITQAVSALVSHHEHLNHALLNQKPDASRAAILLVTSDRGFCGGYNNNVLKQGEALAARIRERGDEPVMYVCGSKGADWYRFRGRTPERAWSGFSGRPSYEVAAEIGQTLVEAFDRRTADGGVGEIHIVYQEFVNLLTYQPVVRRILPLEVEERESGEAGGELPPSYEFDPSPADVLDGLLRQYVRSRVWHILLEAAASEHGARRAAMMAATQNAKEIINDLTRQANQARQEEITEELSEIVGGADALKATHETA